MLPSSNHLFNIFWDPRLPILINSPHSGTAIPNLIAQSMTSEGLSRQDTDLFVDELYDFAPSMGVGLMSANYSRYVVDLNRPLPGGEPLYPNQRSDTGVCPIETFRNQPIYLEDMNPSRAEVERRLALYYQPYYEALEQLLNHLLQYFPKVLLFDAHSIASDLPGFMDDAFPDFMPGNRKGQTCPQALMDVVVKTLQIKNYRVVCNSPFQGGHITRYFGQLNSRIYTIQLEMSQSLYLEQSTAQKSGHFDHIKTLLKQLVQNLADFMNTEMVA